MSHPVTRKKLSLKSQVTKLPGPILVQVITNGQPMPFGGELVNDVVSAEMVTDPGHVGRCSPIDQASHVVSPDKTEHLIRPGFITDGRRTASADTGGLDNSWHERKEPIDELGSVVLLGSDMCDNVTAPVIPVGQDVHLMRRDGPVDRSCPVDTQVMSEPSVLLGLRMDWMEDAAVGPVGHDGNLSEQGAAGHRLDPTGSRRETDRPVLTEKREDTHIGPVGLEVVLAEEMNTMNRPDPVGHHGEMEQSVFLRPDADQEGHISTNSVHPGVTMFSILSQWLTGRRARIEHAARWVMMGCTQSMTKTGKWLVARWAGSPIPTFCRLVKCHS